MSIKRLSDDLLKVWAITEKDIRMYYLKSPSIFFGIVFPLILYFTFAMGRPCVTEAHRLTGVVTVSALFGATSVEAVVFSLERRSRTMDRLLVAPIHPGALIFGKAISGAIFGFIVAIIVGAILMLFGSFWRWTGLMPGLKLEPVTFMIAVFLTSIVSSSLGMIFSVKARDITEAMWPLNVIRFLMIFICGVFIPLDETFAFMPSAKFIAYLFPITYSVEALMQATFGMIQPRRLLLDFLALIFFSATFLMIAVKIFNRSIR
ncbi:ABC transporter permease [Candidatus Bathyarchaeota archaeon]|nr:ABC transporter permease [Candidatus Bathyarchaeota archaeon]RLG95108.1 MAG: hypothetical protein DRO37_03490 [Candidatus Bathyarchaeota archaeon]